jgi:hypothetical protein
MNEENRLPAGTVPQRGDLVHFRYRSAVKTNHIGIITQVKDGWIYTVEGNGRNSGHRGYCVTRAYRLDNPYIKCFSRF